MKFILNIGLNSGKGQINPGVALQAVQLNNLLVLASAVHQSDTEPTLVVEVEALHGNPRWLITSIERLSNELHQDCIATYRPLTGKGALIGPRAAAWGQFNPEFFLLLNGSILGGGLVTEQAA